MLEGVIPNDHNILYNLFPKFNGVNVINLHMLLMLDIGRPLQEGSYVSSSLMKFIACMVKWIKTLKDGWGIQSSCICNSGDKYSYEDQDVFHNPSTAANT